jgi:hypothetical protein
MATTKITSPDLFNLESLNSALKLPSGTTAERPTSPSTGEWRYNTTTNLVEFYDGAEWRDLQSENIPPINSENFNTVLYTGTGSAQSITGVGFKPDFVWIKDRDTNFSHAVTDSTRGVGNIVKPNTTDAQSTDAQTITSFDADGFSLGTAGGSFNNNGDNYVAWCWKANGGTTSSNTDGTTTSTVQANTKAEFSIVQWPQTAGASTNVGHGLNSAPDLIITKAINDTDNWYVYNSASGVGKFSYLNLSNGEATSATAYSAVDATTFTANLSNNSGINMISYCFASVAQYSSIGTYTGNGSINGPIVNTGFEPAFLMTKQTNTSSNWVIVDNKRSTTNPRNKGLRPNTDDTESTVGDNMVVDFLTNGFQLKQTSGANDNGGTFLYIAFASDASAAPALADSFAIKNYSGNSGTQSITGLGFSPSWVWIKKTSGSEDHALFDIVRGVQRQISTNLQSADYTTSNAISSFDADGWTTGNNGATNSSGDYASWNWKANINPNINTDGTIQSVVSANQAAGFSIVKYTGNGVNGSTVGHGLGVAPEVMIIKSLSSVLYWAVYSKYNTGSSGNPATERLKLPGTSATATTTIYWDSTEPDSSVFTIGTDTDVNTNGDEFIAYCFSAITGFSKSGTYTSNASTKITTGFQPDFFIFKYIGGGDWYIQDSTMSEGAVGANGGDLIKKYLEPNNNTQELSVSTGGVEIMSDGFYPTNWFDTTNGVFYMAFKENPAPRPLAGNMSFLIVGGGAAGGSGNGGSGGGGAGGLKTSYGGTSGGGSASPSDITLAAGTYTITVGGGGAGVGNVANTVGNDGSDSELSGPSMTTINCDGGGGGGAWQGQDGRAGGSGGGGGAKAAGTGNTSGGAGSAGQGFAGGTGWDGTTPYAGGGGGGASQAGENGGNASVANGGNGLAVSISGTSVAYAGGGGSGTEVNTYSSEGQGGTGGGGTGGTNTRIATAGTANTGGGGGGGGYPSGYYDNGAGGSGLVVLRLLTSQYSGTTTGSPTVTTDGDYSVLTYTGSGTYVHS